MTMPFGVLINNRNKWPVPMHKGQGHIYNGGTNVQTLLRRYFLFRGSSPRVHAMDGVRIVQLIFDLPAVACPENECAHSLPVPSLFVGPFDETALDPWTAVCKLLPAIILDALSPDPVLSFGMELGNTSLSGLRKVNTDPSSFVQKLHWACSMSNSSAIERAWEGRLSLRERSNRKGRGSSSRSSAAMRHADGLA